MSEILTKIRLRYRAYLDVGAGVVIAVMLGSVFTILAQEHQQDDPVLVAQAHESQAVINERLLNRDALTDVHLEELRHDIAELKTQNAALECRMRDSEKQLNTLTAIGGGGTGLLGFFQILGIFLKQRDARRDRRRAENGGT